MWPFSKKISQERAEPVLNAAFSVSSDSIYDIFGAGYNSNIVTESSAMRLSAVHACVRIIAGSLSSLPLHLYRRTETGRDKIKDDNLWWLLSEEPTPRYTAASMWEFVGKSILLRGDSFVFIRRDFNGAVREFIPLRREQVMVERSGNRLNYYVNDDDRYFGVQQEDMLHFAGLGFDGVQSQSVISHYGRTTLGIAAAAEDHTERYFKTGTMQKFALMQKGKMTQDALQSLRDQWYSTYGGVENANKPLVLVEGTEIKELSLTAADAQLLESRKFSVEDIARFFGVPPHMIGHTEKSSSWGTGLEQMSTAFVIYTLQPHLVRIEQELNRKLFRTASRFFEFETKGLMRGDSQAQSNFFKTALGGSGGSGWMTQNEVRALNNLPPIEGGDTVSTWIAVQPKTADQPANAANSANMAVMTINEIRQMQGLERVEGGDVLMFKASKTLKFNELTQKIEEQ